LGGAEIDHPSAPKEVLAVPVAEFRTSVLSGTFRVYGVPLAVNVIVWLVTFKVTGVEPTPETFAALENHT
jgi:hypothetical protein